jgi:ketosteroid isomerase-like protein
MNQLRPFFVLILLLLAPTIFLFQSCQPEAAHEHAPEVNQDSVKAKLAAVDAAFAAGINSKNLDAVAALYASDAQVLAPDEPVRVGTDAVRAGLKIEMDEDTTGNKIAFAATGVWAAGNFATESGKITVTSKDGKVVYTGKFLTLFELRNGKYVILRDIWNGDAPE